MIHKHCLLTLLQRIDTPRPMSSCALVNMSLQRGEQNWAACIWPPLEMRLRFVWQVWVCSTCASSVPDLLWLPHIGRAVANTHIKFLCQGCSLVLELLLIHQAMHDCHAELDQSAKTDATEYKPMQSLQLRQRAAQARCRLSERLEDGNGGGGGHARRKKCMSCACTPLSRP